jgi:hypothetical protein
MQLSLLMFVIYLSDRFNRDLRYNFLPDLSSRAFEGAPIRFLFEATSRA